MPSPIRLQDYALGIFISAPTKSALKKAIKKNCISVNNIPANSATYIYGGESICLTIPKKKIPKKKLICSLKVLYEDDHLALIHKPAGLLVSGNKHRTIANALPQNLQTSHLPDAVIPQPVHRLDFATSGILLIGKTSSSIRALNKMFEEKEIKKIYYAVCIGKMKKRASIRLDIDGKESQTDYQLVQSVPSKKFEKLNLVKLAPSTGRRHQLRKHLASFGNPILGDKEYGIENLILKGKGLYLHAFSLQFIHPVTNETVVSKCDLPEKFHKIFTTLEIGAIPFL